MIKKTKMNSNTKKLGIKNIIAIFLIQLAVAFPFYTLDAFGLSISNVKVSQVTATSATIEWDTDEIAKGAVMYGKTKALGFTQAHDNFIQHHVLSLFNGMESDTAYFFSVKSANLSGASAIDNNSNNFYTFRTIDITPPPEVNGLAVVSRTSNSIFLSWNPISIPDFNHFIIDRNGIPVANATTNSFNDTNLESGKSYNYKVSAADNSNNTGPKSGIVLTSTLGIDLANPSIANIDVIPVTDIIAKVSWLTDENSTSAVFYGINKTDKSKAMNGLITNHTVFIDGLVKGIKHSFIVQSCDSSGNCANSSAQNFVAGKDLIAPFINLTIPRFANRRVIDIIGSTEPFTSATLFVNDMRIPKRSFSSNEVGSSGKFIFPKIQLEQDNFIKMVFVDKSGNKNEKLFETSVDTETPSVNLNDVPALTSKTNATFSGAVSEPVVIKVFIEPAGNLAAIPSKIAGLNAAKIGQNFIELHWNETENRDFSHYVVYRQDSSPIAITKPANFNLFIDALVDSGKSYTYQVSAVNVFANEGPKSEPITATTLGGGSILGIRPSDVDIFAEFKKPFLLINSTGAFNFGIKLDKGDGVYRVRIVFEDRAGNSVVLERIIALDTKKPEIKITSPSQGAFVFENVAHEIDITGTTKPNARVHLFVDRTPFSFYNETLEISGLPNEIDIGKLPETQLDARCRSKLIAGSFCRTGADFSTTADASGNFKFERVDLTAVFGGAARLGEVSPSQLASTGGNLNQDARQSKTTTLVVIATDQIGLRGVATQSVRIGTCWSGNQSWDVIPLTQYQNPAFLSTERLADGTEAIWFYLNFSYLGSGTNARIADVSITKACSDRQLVDPRFNTSCLLMPPGNKPRLLNPPENTISYSAMPLTRIPGMERFLEKDWKKFFKSMNNELTFPLQIRIRYTHDKDNDGRMEAEEQTTCEQVSYVLDNSVIDPRRALPDWLLFDAVDYLQSSIKTLDSVQEQLNQLLNYVAFACITSWGLNIGLGIYRRWMTFADEKGFIIKDKVNTFAGLAEQFRLTDSNGQTSTDQEYCKKIIKHIGEKNQNSFKLKYLSDKDLNKCFPSTANAWKAEAKAYQYMRLSCDRIFGHSSPSGWTDEKSDEEIFAKIEKPSGCKKDQGAVGQPLRAMSCTEFARQYPRWGSVRNEGQDKKCLLVTQNNQPKVYVVEDLEKGSDNLYKLIFISQEGVRSGEYIYAVRKDKSNDVDYIIAQSKTCPELCGTKPEQGKVNQFVVSGGGTFTQTISNLQPKQVISSTPLPGETTVVNGKDVQVIQRGGKYFYRTKAEDWIGDYEGKKNADGTYTFDILGSIYNINNEGDMTLALVSKTIKGKAAGCATVNNCLAFNKQNYIGKDEQEREVEFSVDYAQNAGFSKECFYDPNGPNNAPDVVSDDPAKTVVCCCINTNKEIERRYYQPDDKVPYHEVGTQLQNFDPQAHQSKETAATSQVPVAGNLATQVQTAKSLGETDFKSMDWSYRYFKEGFQTVDAKNPLIRRTQYNPNRYITGRDFTACFGQDNYLYVLANKREDVITIDPARQHEAALQCAHIVGIVNRIQMLKNFAGAMSTCLIQVRTTGKADAGVCKELFTQYICSSIWQLIRFFIDGCTPTIGDTAKGFGDNEILQYVRGGLKGVYESVGDLQSTMNDEYGNAKINELFGIGEESIARKACLAAFGYDWNLNMKNFIDAAYSTPFATFVQAVTKSREFLTVEPGNLKPKYAYRASWLINPGCNFERYNVYLSCVGQRQISKYPNDVSCGSVGAPSIAYTGKTPFTGPSQAFSQCDCMNLPDGRRKLVYSGRLTQNKLEDVALPAGQRVVTDDVRYDHIEFELLPDRKIPANTKLNCFPTGYDEGKFYFPLTDKTARDILDCRVDPASGSFVCGPGQVFGAKKGTANFLDLKLNGNDASKTDLVFNAGDLLHIDTTIRNIGKEKCIKAVLDGEVKADIIQEGVNPYSLDFSKSLTIGTAPGINVVPSGVSVEPGNSQNSQPVQISLRFYDDSGNSIIDFTKINDQLFDTIKVFGISEPSSVKTSEISTDSLNPTILGAGAIDQKVVLYLYNGALVVKKQNAEVKVTSAELQRGVNNALLTDTSPTGKQVPYSYAQITVQSMLQLPQTTAQNQQKTIEIALYNIFDNVETAEGNIANCNFNDIVAASGGIKKILFKVQQKPTALSGTAVISDPAMKTQNKFSSQINARDGIDISVRVAGNTGNPAMQCTPPDGKAFPSNPGAAAGIYTFSIQEPNLKIAGIYNCKITAQSSNINAQPATKEFSFEVYCGNGVGKCNSNGDCIGLPANTNAITPCKSEGQIRQETINTANELLKTITTEPEGTVLGSGT